MNLKNYPYGKTTKTLKDGVGWLRKTMLGVDQMVHYLTYVYMIAMVI